MKKLVILLLVSILSFASTYSQNTTQEIHAKNSKQTNKTIPLNKSDFLKKVFNYESDASEWKYIGDKPAIIDFYANWCGPCKAIAPVLEALAAEYADQIYIYKIDTEQEQELAAIFGIRSIPSLLFIPINGQPQMTQGAQPKPVLKEAIDKLLLNK